MMGCVKHLAYLSVCLSLTPSSATSQDLSVHATADKITTCHPCQNSLHEAIGKDGKAYFATFVTRVQSMNQLNTF